MAKTGRPAKPTPLKLLHGDRKDRIPQGEPVPATTEVLPPGSLDADALAIWHQLAPDLIRQGVLTAWDAHLFGIFCQSVVYQQRAALMVNQTSIMLRGRNRGDTAARGEVAVRNPALMVFRDMSDLALAEWWQVRPHPQ